MFAFKALVTLGLLYFIFQNVNLYKLADILVSADLIYLVMSACLYAFTFIIGGKRWHVIIRGFCKGISLLLCIRAFFISGFLSQIVIGGGYGGDIYRVLLVADKVGGKFISFLTVLIDRLSGLVAAAIVIAFSGPLYWVIYPEHFHILFIISIVSALSIFALYMISKLNPGYPITELNDCKTYQKVLIALRMGFQGSRYTFDHILWSLAALIVNMLALALIGVSLSLALDFYIYFLLGPIVFLAKSFPLSVAGWGTREMAVIYFFGFSGLSAENGLALSLLSGILVLTGSSVGIIFWLFSHKFTALENDKGKR